MNNSIIESELKMSSLFVLGLGGVSYILFGTYIVFNSFLGEYLQIILTILGSLFVGFGIYFLLILFKTNRLRIHNDKIEIQTLSNSLKQTIPLSSITNYSEIDNGNWFQLTIYTNETAFKISTGNYSNYEEIKREIIKGKKEINRAQYQYEFKLSIIIGFGFTLVGLIFLFWFGGMYLDRNNVLTSKELSEIHGTLESKLEIIKTGKRKHKLSIPVMLKEYPNLKFSLSGVRLKATNYHQLMSKVKDGDEIIIKMLTNQFKKKVSKETPLSFWDKYNNNNYITIYGISENSRQYFNLKYYNDENVADKNSWSMLLLVGFSLFILGFGIYELLNLRNPAANTIYDRISSSVGDDDI